MSNWNEWDTTVTLDEPAPGDEEILAAMLTALPSGIVGRSPRDGRLTVSMTIGAPTAAEAAQLALNLVRNATHTAGLGHDLPVVALEVLDPEETERRTELAEQPLELVSVSEAADMLNLTPAAVRAQAQQGRYGAVKVGESGWALRKHLVEQAAAGRRGREATPQSP